LRSAGLGAVAEALAAERHLLVGGQVVMPDDQLAGLVVVAAHGQRMAGVEQRRRPGELVGELAPASAGVRRPCGAEVLPARAQQVRRHLDGLSGRRGR
jgi:hypothetical protein